MVVVFGVVLYPLVQTVFTSFHDVNSALPGPTAWVGLANYAKILSDSDFWSSLERTAYFTFVTTTLEIIVGIVLGLILTAKFRGRVFVRAVVIIPWAIPTIVSGALWRWIYNGDYGPLNSLLVQLHLLSSYKQWLGDPWLALHMVMIEDVWKYTPFVALFIMAGLGTIPGELREAAFVDGATAWRHFWAVTLPLLRPVILIVLVLRTIDGFRLFDIVYVMTHGGPANGTETLAFYTYVSAFSNQNFGLGSAISVLITLIILIITIAYTRILRSQEMS